MLFGAAGAILIAGMLEIADRARRTELLTANVMIARAVAGYLTVVAPVDGASEYQLVGLLSAAHTLAASARWHRGIQVAWGNSPLLSDSLKVAPLDTATRRILAAPGGTGVVERSGRSVALVPLLDGNLAHSIGWVAAWGMLAPGGKRLVYLGILALIVAAAGPALLLPAALLPQRTRWGLVLIAAAGAILLAVHEDHRVQELAVRREAMVQGRVQQLTERALSMPRIDKQVLGRIEVGPRQLKTGWGRLERLLATGAGGFGLLVCLGAWSQGNGRRNEKAEDAENSTPLRS